MQNLLNSIKKTVGFKLEQILVLTILDNMSIIINPKRLF